MKNLGAFRPCVILVDLNFYQRQNYLCCKTISAITVNHSVLQNLTIKELQCWARTSPNTPECDERRKWDVQTSLCRENGTTSRAFLVTEMFVTK